MLKQHSVNYAIFALIVDLLGTAGAFWAGARLRAGLPWGLPLGDAAQNLYTLPLVAEALLLWLLVALVSSLYDPSRSYRAVDEFQNVGLAVLFYALALAGMLFFSERWISRLLVIYIIAIQWTALLGWRGLARIYFRMLHQRSHRKRHVLIVGAGEVGQRLGGLIREYEWTGLQLAGYLDDDPHKREHDGMILGSLDDAREVVEREHVEDVVVALPLRAYTRLNGLVAALQKQPVHIRVIPDYFSLALYRAKVEDFGGVPMISLRDLALNDVQRLVKRLLDLLFGGILTLMALPVMGLVALAIKLDSPGPVLFRQQRVGENGRLFVMYKFRSMVVGAEEQQPEINERDEQGHVIHKKQDDPRVTRVGRIIRRTSLDELPQLFNVLKGDMSLVGPRPELPWLVDRYEPWQRKRFAVPQGLTGWWQVHGRSERLMHLHTEDDLHYIQNYSVWLDLRILWKTIWVVLRGKGAY